MAFLPNGSILGLPELDQGLNLGANVPLDPTTAGVQAGLQGFQRPRGIMGALQGLGRGVQKIDPMTWAMISAGIGGARGGSPIGNIMSGVGQGLAGSQQMQSLKEKQMAFKEQREQQKADRQAEADKKAYVRQAALDALKTVDRNQDGVVDDAKQQGYYNLLQAAAATSDERLLAEAAKMVAPESGEWGNAMNLLTDETGQLIGGLQAGQGGGRYLTMEDMGAPQGARLARNPTEVDYGPGIQLRGPGGQVIADIPKGLNPGEEPAVRAEQEAAVQNERRLSDLRVSYPKARSRVRMIKNRREKIVLPAIDKAIEMVSAATTGPAGALTWVAGAPPRDLQETLRPVKSNIGFDQLQQLRADSPTGGAVGNVSDFENRELQAVLGSLDQMQSPTQLLGNLNSIREFLTLNTNDLDEALQMDYAEILNKRQQETNDSEGWSLEPAE